jgi:hypothetical protein
MFIGKFKSKDMLAIVLIISILRIILDKDIYSLIFLKQFVIFSIIFVLLQTLLVELGKKVFCEKCCIKDLKPGMILAEDIYHIGDKYKKVINESLIEKSIKKQNKIDLCFKHTGNGLTEEDINNIRRLNKQKKICFFDININKITPFAHYLFIGVLITIIFKGNLIATLLNLESFLSEFSNGLILLVSSIVFISVLTVIIYIYINKNNKGYK